MFNKNNKTHVRLFIESPLIINNIQITLSESRLELKDDKNLMIHCEEQESGIALMRAILGLEKISEGMIYIKTEKKELFIDRKRNVDFLREDIRIAYVSKDGSDYCRDLTIMENLNLLGNSPDFNQRIQQLATDFLREDIRIAYVSKDGSDYCRDLTIMENLNLLGNSPDFNQRIQQLATDFLVEENLDYVPDSVSIRRRKIFSIIRAWAFLPDIIVYTNPLEYLDDFSKIEILRNFAIPKEDSAWLSVVYVPSIGELSTVLHNFHLVEIIHSDRI